MWANSGSFDGAGGTTYSYNSVSVGFNYDGYALAADEIGGSECRRNYRNRNCGAFNCRTNCNGACCGNCCGDDAYRVFRKMLASGHPPDDWNQLLDEVRTEGDRLQQIAAGVAQMQP